MLSVERFVRAIWNSVMETEIIGQFQGVWFYVGIVCLALWLLKLLFRSPKYVGLSGEERVARRLSLLPKEVYKVFNDFMLPTVDGATTQVDHVIVSRYGIFVIETKNYGGWIFGDEKQRTWTQSFQKGYTGRSEKFHFQNPIRQNWRHIYTMSDCLELPRRYFFNVVVFCGDGEFMTDMPENVMYSADLCSYIQSFDMPIMSDAKVEQLILRLATFDASIPEEKRLSHISNLRAAHDSAQLSVACERGELKCPKCGAPMVERHRKSDGAAFYGCSKYPQCRGTRQA